MRRLALWAAAVLLPLVVLVGSVYLGVSVYVAGVVSLLVLTVTLAGFEVTS